MSSPTPTHAAVVGVAVAKARTKRGLTQLQLAHKIGLSGDDAGAAISRLESGTQEPRLAKLSLIAKVLGVHISELLPR